MTANFALQRLQAHHQWSDAEASAAVEQRRSEIRTSNRRRCFGLAFLVFCAVYAECFVVSNYPHGDSNPKWLITVFAGYGLVFLLIFLLMKLVDAFTVGFLSKYTDRATRDDLGAGSLDDLHAYAELKRIGTERPELRETLLQLVNGQKRVRMRDYKAVLSYYTQTQAGHARSELALSLIKSNNHTAG